MKKIKINNTLVAVPKGYNFIKIHHVGELKIELIKDLPNGAEIKTISIDHPEDVV